MAPCLIYLLAAALCLSQAAALMCYTCETPTVRSECTTQTNCSSKFTFCKTIVFPVDTGYPFENVETVIRSCAEGCTATDTDDLVTTNPILCCTADLCNNIGVSDDASISISRVSLVALLGLVWALHMLRS